MSSRCFFCLIKCPNINIFNYQLYKTKKNGKLSDLRSCNHQIFGIFASTTDNLVRQISLQTMVYDSHEKLVFSLLFHKTVNSPREEILVWLHWSFLQHQACRRRYWGICKENLEKVKTDSRSCYRLVCESPDCCRLTHRWQFTWLTWGTTWDQRHLWSSHLLSLFSLSGKEDIHFHITMQLWHTLIYWGHVLPPHWWNSWMSRCAASPVLSPGKQIDNGSKNDKETMSNIRFVELKQPDKYFFIYSFNCNYSCKSST